MIMQHFSNIMVIIPETMREKLAQKAKTEMRSLSNMIRAILADGLTDSQP